MPASVAEVLRLPEHVASAVLSHSSSRTVGAQHHPPGKATCCCCWLQNLLNGNGTKLSSLRYGDAKKLPAVDKHFKPGFDSVVMKLLPGIRVSYNTGVSVGVRVVSI